MSDTAGSFAKELLEQAETARKNQFSAKVDYMVAAFERECKLQADGGKTTATLVFSRDTTTTEHVEEFRKRILGDPKNEGIEILSDSVTNEGHFRVNVSWEHAEDIRKAKACLYEFRRSLKIAIENGYPVHSWYVKKGSCKFERLVAEGIGEIWNANGIAWPAYSQTAVSQRNHWIYVCDLPEKEQRNKAETSVPAQTHSQDVFNALLSDFVEIANDKIKKGRASFEFSLFTLSEGARCVEFVHKVSDFFYVDRVESGMRPCTIKVFLKDSSPCDAKPNTETEKEYKLSLKIEYSRSKLVIYELMRFAEKALYFLKKGDATVQFDLNKNASKQDALDFQDLACHYIFDKHGFRLNHSKLWYDTDKGCMTYLFNVS